MVDGRSPGQAEKAMYLIGEEMSIVDSNANYVGAGVQRSWNSSSCRRCSFSSTCQFADVCWSSVAEPEKKARYQHRARIQRLYQVFEPLEGFAARLANHSGRRQSSRRRLELSASL